MTWETARKRLDYVILAVDDDGNVVGEIEAWDSRYGKTTHWKAEPLGPAASNNPPKVCDSLEQAKAYIQEAQPCKQR